MHSPLFLAAFNNPKFLKKFVFLGFILYLLLPAKVLAADAPVTMASNIINAIPGTSSVPIPITVNGFNNIGSFTLTLKFDTTRVRYISGTTSTSLPGMTITYSSPVGNTQGKLVLTWTGTLNKNLPDGSTIAILNFSYISGTGILGWAYTYGSICQYKRYIGGVLSTLNDNPKYNFYLNGGISNRSAPVTVAPFIAVSDTGALSIPLTVNAFTSIEAFTLYLEYDPAVLTYQNSFTKNPAFGSSFQVGNNPGSGSNLTIVIQWYGSAVNLSNGSVICTLNFKYTTAGASGVLNWFDSGPSCEYADATSALIDLPSPVYYQNGVIAPALNASFIANNLTPLRNEPVQFTDQTSGNPTYWNWTFDRPGVVYLNGTSAGSQNPLVSFTDGGPFSVTLNAGNNYFADTETRTAYIRAGMPGLWTGISSTDWSVLTNWDNHLIPDGSTQVTIPPVAQNWPVFSGDLTIGIHCMTLILSGTTSQLTITGNLTIP